MAKRKKTASRRSKIGLPPGTPVHISNKETTVSYYYLTAYNSNEFRRERYEKLTDFKNRLGSSEQVTWIHAEGQLEVRELEALGQQFGIHSLTLEDLANHQHRPKVEIFDNYYHFVIKALSYDGGQKTVIENQINVVLGRDFVLSVSESACNYFEPIFNRLNAGRGIIRNMKGDYLAYCLLDYVVDNYFLVVEGFESMVDELESQVFDDGSKKVISSLYDVKRQGLSIRKITGPVKEMVASVRRQKNELIRPEVETYFNDLYDHISEVHDSLNGVRMSLVNLVDVSFANSSERANSVMKVLAVISAIFLPLNFVVGVFGMNFNGMPGTESAAGFYSVVASLAILSIVLATFFKRKGWW